MVRRVVRRAGQLTLQPDSFNDIPVTLTNQGRLTWQSSAAPPFALSYHWLAPGSEEVVIFDGLRTSVLRNRSSRRRSEDAGARSRAGVSRPIRTDLGRRQEHRTWLSLEGVYPGRSTASVEGAAVGAPLPTRGRMPSSVMRMPRSVLWQTALRVWRDHPWLGIGPDNFRHTYGRYLGLAAWDVRVHTNNSYLEVLTGMGAIGAAALVPLIVLAARSVRRMWANADSKTLPLLGAATAACLAIATHALVDSFLTFTPTYVAFAIAGGLLFGRSTQHAHRV
jgi:hypothetical protein